MDHNVITVENSLDEENLENDNHHGENWTPNPADSPSPKKEIPMAKKGPMHPTRL